MMKKQILMCLMLVGVLLLGSAPAQAAATPPAAAAPAAYNCATATGILAADCQALVAFYNSTNGASWTTHTDWLVSSTPCTWYGVQCVGNRVTELGTGGLLEGNNLGGTLPTELGNLSALQILDLTNNHIGGAVPTQLGGISTLVWLQLGSNALTGSIPTQLGSLAALEDLELSYNQLSGTIPTQLGSLANLLFMNLTGNQLTGAIPTQLGGLPNLALLSLGENQLTGALPAQLGGMANLQLLDVHTNQLSGMVPAELGNDLSLYQIYLAGNSLSRNLPQNLRNLFPTDLTYTGTTLCAPPDSGFQGWLGGITNAQTTGVNCAAQKVTVKATNTTNDVVLTWTDLAPNTGYEMHRGATPYFTAGAGTLQTTLAEPTATWTNTGAYADANNYYYLVRSKFTDSYNNATTNDLSADSNRTGKFVFSLVKGG